MKRLHLGLVDEAKIADVNGIEYLSFPIPDRGVPASSSAAISLIASIVDALENGKNVALHCRQGIGRSGLIAAGVFESSGLSPKQAIEVVSKARGVIIPETTGAAVVARKITGRTANCDSLTSP